MEPYLGQIILFAGNFAPRGWAFCDGNLLPISNYQALFSLLGTTYGGDGRTTFALPDLRSRVPRGEGTGPGLNPVQLGEKAGALTHTLSTAELPPHNHGLLENAHAGEGDTSSPAGHVLANGSGDIYSDQTADAMTLPATTASAGNGQSFSTVDPYLGLNYIIAVTGLFPSRN